MIKIFWKCRQLSFTNVVSCLCASWNLTVGQDSSGLGAYTMIGRPQNKLWHGPYLETDWDQGCQVGLFETNYDKFGFSKQLASKCFIIYQLFDSLKSLSLFNGWPFPKSSFSKIQNLAFLKQSLAFSFTSSWQPWLRHIRTHKGRSLWYKIKECGTYIYVVRTQIYIQELCLEGGVGGDGWKGEWDTFLTAQTLHLTSDSAAGLSAL